MIRKALMFLFVAMIAIAAGCAMPHKLTVFQDGKPVKVHVSQGRVNSLSSNYNFIDLETGRRTFVPQKDTVVVKLRSMQEAVDIIKSK